MAELCAMADTLFKASPTNITVGTTINQMKAAISKAHLVSNQGRKNSSAHGTERHGKGSAFCNYIITAGQHDMNQHRNRPHLLHLHFYRKKTTMHFIEI